MKNIIFLLLFTNNAFAQPGDIPEYRARRVESLTQVLQKNPNDSLARWDRLQLIFDPHFDMMSKPKKANYNDTLLSFGGRVNLSYRKIDVLTEINKLIDDNAFIIELGGRTNGIDDTISFTPSSLFFKRGQYYYLQDEQEKALADYLSALSYHPPKFFKERICISLAAYYYNKNDRDIAGNLKKALEYIDLVTPLTYEKRPRNLGSYSETFPDRFEQEKITLLKATGNKERLVNYVKNLALSYLNLYITEMLKTQEYKNEHTYTIPQTLTRALGYITMLAEYDYRSKSFMTGEASVEFAEGLIRQLSDR